MSFGYEVKSDKYVLIKNGTDLTYYSYEEMTSVSKVTIHDNSGAVLGNNITFSFNLSSLGFQSYNIPYNNAIEATEIISNIKSFIDEFMS